VVLVYGSLLLQLLHHSGSLLGSQLQQRQQQHSLQRHKQQQHRLHLQQQQLDKGCRLGFPPWLGALWMAW
jgi:hypothetical protein